MSKTIFPVISDEVASRTWQKQLLITSTVACFGGVALTALLALAVTPGVLNDLSKWGTLLGGALLIAFSTAAASWVVDQRIVAAVRIRMQFVRKFLQDAGHELATPVAVLGSRIQVMERENSLNGVDGDSLEVLSESTRRLSVLVDDMRALARAEAPRNASDLSLINLGEMIRSIKAQMKDVCDSRAIEISVEVQTPATIIGEHDGIVRAISNLLSNSVRYGRHGGRVAVTVRSSKSSVVIAVHDDGIGISADDLPKIFDRFYRAEEVLVSKTPGSGLGLAIVKAVVESHSGSVSVDSELGRFTRFTLEFPKSPVHPIMKMMKSNM